MNIHTQARLLVKYELVSPRSLRDRAITKTESQGLSIGHDLGKFPIELQIGTQMHHGQPGSL